jgi:hypothetical protein
VESHEAAAIEAFFFKKLEGFAPLQTFIAKVKAKGQRPKAKV